jgi:hypothetical protein
MVRRGSVLIATLVVCGSAGWAEAQTAKPRDERLVILASVGYLITDETFAERNTFVQYLEPATVEAEYRLRSGSIFDAAVSVPLMRRLAVQGGVAVISRAAEAAVLGELPAPFEFGRLRSVEQPLEPVEHREVALRAELAWAAAFGDWVLTASGGPALIRVEHDFAAGIQVREIGYPYDQVELEVGALDRAQAWAVGGTAAADLAWYPNTRVGVGVTGRFTGARWEARGIRINAGGPSVVVGLRLRP